MTAPAPARPPAPDRVWVVLDRHSRVADAQPSEGVAARMARRWEQDDPDGRPFTVHAYRLEDDGAPA